jgi:response regulator of citrate/malate metabolism
MRRRLQEDGMQTVEQWQLEFEVLENAREAAQKRFSQAAAAVINQLVPPDSSGVPPETLTELVEATKVRDKAIAAVDDFIATVQRSRIP